MGAGRMSEQELRNQVDVMVARSPVVRALLLRVVGAVIALAMGAGAWAASHYAYQLQSMVDQQASNTRAIEEDSRSIKELAAIVMKLPNIYQQKELATYQMATITKQLDALLRSVDLLRDRLLGMPPRPGP